jgi:PLP dependent protein
VSRPILTASDAKCTSGVDTDAKFVTLNALRRFLSLERDRVPVDSERLSRNLAAVRSRMAAAAVKSGRTIQSVKLVAVTKTVDVAEVRILNSLGVKDFGENRVPELVRKSRELVGTDAIWHMIGHLQRNKVKELLPHSSLVHAVESEDLAVVLSRRAVVLGLNLVVLIEVNVSGEEAKYGVAPSAAAALADRIAGLPALRLRGLMTMAPMNDDAEASRPVFAGLRELAANLAPGLPPGAMSELSMGMTQDFEVAIEEGATMVRVGSALFA